MSPQDSILVTGGTGFVGSHLIDALIAKGFSNIHATHFGSADPKNTSSVVQFHKVDLTDSEATVALFETVRPTQIYHLASFAAVGKSFERAKLLLQNNVTLQLSVLEAAKKVAPQSRFLHIGSAEEYGRTDLKEGESIDESFPLNPAEPYGVSKVTQDLLAQTFFYAYQLPVIRVRPFNHIGEGQTADFVVSAFASQIAAVEKNQQTELLVGNLAAVRDFTDVKDMVQAYILLMEKGIPGEIYNIGSGRGNTIQFILDSLIKLANAPIQVKTDPSRMRPSEIPYFVANNAKITGLGWSPTIPLSETLQRIQTDWRSKT